MDAKDYQNVLNKDLLAVSEEIERSCFMFQLDNASIRSTNHTFEWFLSNVGNIIDWTASSID